MTLWGVLFVFKIFYNLNICENKEVLKKSKNTLRVSKVFLLSTFMIN